jgi:tRNA dimethylallyltransferase
VKNLIIISGPTGSGKTELAIKVAQHFKTEIVSADSRQIYQGLEIGTAQPDAEQLAQVKHHLIGFRKVTEDYNAGLYEQDALKAIDKIFSENTVAVVCGGTGLYIDALLYGMDDLPPATPEIRAELEHQYQLQGIEFLQEELKVRDPQFALIMDLKNPRRLIRALEICIVSGQPYSSFRTGKKASRSFNYIYYSLNPSRETLYSQINYRTEKMFESGIIEEARQMMPFRKSNALQTVGYREIFDFLDGIIPIEEAKTKVKQHTRNYAKRQLTWLKKRSGIIFVDPADAFSEIINNS